MQVKIEYTREQFFSIEVEIDNADEILAWINEGRLEADQQTALSGSDVKDWLESSQEDWEPGREPTWRDEAGPAEYTIERVIVPTS